jgi:hypothetical protein
MDLFKMIAELQEERHRLQEAIEALERLSATSKRRSRPFSKLGIKLDQPEDNSGKLLQPPLPKGRKNG